MAKLGLVECSYRGEVAKGWSSAAHPWLVAKQSPSLAEIGELCFVRTQSFGHQFKR